MSSSLLSKYEFAKSYVFDNGYSSEISWQANLRLDQIDEQTFLREFAWVVLCVGMREKIIRSLFGRISECFFDWISSGLIVRNEDACYNNAIKVFRSQPKILAIITGARKVHSIGFDHLKSEIERHPIETLREFPYIGPVSAYHLAKNIGLSVAKPDRHLARIADMEGYSDVQAFCAEISERAGDSIPVVDLVLWRFATIEADYLKVLSSIDDSNIDTEEHGGKPSDRQSSGKNHTDRR